MYNQHVLRKIYIQELIFYILASVRYFSIIYSKLHLGDPTFNLFMGPLWFPPFYYCIYCTNQPVEYFPVFW